ncbi:N-acetylmuramoyl-L-alanine amidase LytC precursor [Desulfosporosinus acididurans]|uniref:N-acetylmuramoyl-L-alanine amidase LytC n=1 Tax=Desulfosporosinus acididurans TaxID=476652 RepID=A0A0J1FV84_9FIRM|nr:cell wall-binding repeat-containing protein [Desulfosporosinus acididurans]KLU66893.1 N-acetylmuramoyl-L-alanine amidase LytC precursor [Desulfosporosinus acididurans]
MIKFFTKKSKPTNHNQPYSTNKHKFRLVSCTIALICGLAVISNLVPFHSLVAQAAPADSITDRIYGNTLYDTAIEISKAGWDQAPVAVLATGQNFPDALTGSVLAHKVNGPLLLTESDHLDPAVLSELKRLGTKNVYLLGGTVALSSSIEQTLIDQGITPTRLAGTDQYGTAAAIAGVATPTSDQAFIVNGEHFPDALSISSYAAAHGIPILLTRPDSLPSDTASALAKMGVRQVTLIGGTAVIQKTIEDQLAKLPQPVTVTARYAGYDQYETNSIVLNQLPFDSSKVYVATGENFPDALAGAALAAKTNSPIFLFPSKPLASYTSAYLDQKRSSGTAFTILGGWGVINYKMESILRTGVIQPRISLQFTQGGLSGATGMLSQLQSIPSPATDYADLIGPSWYYLDDAANGNVTGGWDATPGNYTQFTSAVHARDLKVLPVIQSSWASPKTVDTVLSSAATRAALENKIIALIQSTNSDGIVIDFELISDSTGPYLTQFMQELYAKLHPLNKLVIEAVMARTGSESWLTEFNYAALAQNVDYLDVMTYDYSHSTPGPIAPLDWMNKVMEYTKGQGVDMHKVLLGIPYYGNDWWTTGSGSDATYQRKAGGMAELEALAQGPVQRDSSQIPYFNYTDSSGNHTVYYDDAQSWNAKLSLLNQYGLGGIGAWSLNWSLNPASSNAIFPLLKQYLR